MKRGCDILFFNYIKPIQDGAVRDYSRIGGTKSPPPPPKNLSHISCNDESSHIYTLPKVDPKNI